MSCPCDQNISALPLPLLVPSRFFSHCFELVLHKCRNERVNFSTMWPHANVSAIDLLDKMLVFDPTRRITVSEERNKSVDFREWECCDPYTTVSDCLVAFHR